MKKLFLRNTLPFFYVFLKFSYIHTHIFYLMCSKPEPQCPVSTPHTRAIENGGLNRSPLSFLRAPPSHLPRLIRVRSSYFYSSCHHALLLQCLIYDKFSL